MGKATVILMVSCVFFVVISGCGSTPPPPAAPSLTFTGGQVDLNNFEYISVNAFFDSTSLVREGITHDLQLAYLNGGVERTDNWSSSIIMSGSSIKIRFGSLLNHPPLDRGINWHFTLTITGTNITGTAGPLQYGATGVNNNNKNLVAL